MKLVRPSKRDVVIAVVFYLLNLFDTVCTAIMVGSGRAFELNPLMRTLLDHSVWSFVLFKVLVPLVLTALLLIFPAPKRVNAVLVFLAGMYTTVAVVHLLIFWNFNGG